VRDVDNALLACEVHTGKQRFPMLLSTKRIAPGESNTWFIRIHGTEFSAEFTTKFPKTLRTMTYRPGAPQSWEVLDLGCLSSYPTITGAIFEFGFPDAILQMWAAFCDELEHGNQMQQPFGCVTPEETAMHHRVLTAALGVSSHRTGRTSSLERLTKPFLEVVPADQRTAQCASCNVGGGLPHGEENALAVDYKVALRARFAAIRRARAGGFAPSRSMDICSRLRINTIPLVEYRAQLACPIGRVTLSPPDLGYNRSILSGREAP